MAKESIFQYDDREDYLSANNRPTDQSTVSLAGSEVEYKGVNVIVAALPQNCEVGDMLIYDKQELKHKILKMATYNAQTFDSDRYIKSEALWHRNVMNVGLFLYKGQDTQRWAAQCEFELSGLDLTQAGSFSFISTGYQAKAEATTIAWAANDTLASVLAQFTTGNGGVIGNASYNSAAIDGSSIIIMVGGTGTNNITISDKTGGAADLVLTDCSKVCKIGDTLVSDTDTHRSFEGSTVATCFPGIASELLPVTTASYTVQGINRPYRCGVAFQIFKAYCTTSGSSTFVDDSTSGSVLPMTLAKFNACATSEVEAEVACYNRHHGDYDDYLKGAMIDVDCLKGTVGDAYQNFGKEGKLLASIMYKDHNDEWKPCYPAAYQASLWGVTVADYNTGFEPGNIYLSDSDELVGFMNDDIRLLLNPFITAVGGTTLGGLTLWSSSQYNGSNAWRFIATNGTLDISYKMGRYEVRGSLAFKFL